MARKYWLMKSEPDAFSFEDLKNCPKKTEHWDGIRNYQARNFMRDDMQKGDLVLFYHSNAGAETGVVGLAEIVSKEAYPDHTAWDKKEKYYDEKSTQENPRWLMVDVKYRKPFKTPVTLKELKGQKSLADMKVVQRGQRLSIQPVEKKHFDRVCKMGGVSI
jgi:predicted RNA-binding protein with PUA-like domain